jgi:DNA-binding MarR family transcriptional regulator
LVASSRARIRTRLFCFRMLMCRASLRPRRPAVSAEHFVNLVKDMSALAETESPLTVANRLRPVLLRLARELRKEARAFGITGGQAGLLAVVERHGRVGLGQLASEEGVSPPAMSKHVDRLEGAGLVRRLAGVGGDRRRVEIELTREGKRILRRVRSQRTAWLAERLEQLDAGALAAVDRAVEPLAELLAGGS